MLNILEPAFFEPEQIIIRQYVESAYSKDVFIIGEGTINVFRRMDVKRKILVGFAEKGQLINLTGGVYNTHPHQTYIC